MTGAVCTQHSTPYPAPPPGAALAAAGRMRRWWWRVLLVFVVLFAAIAAYRVLGVYEFRYPKRLTVMTFNIEGHASLLKSHHIEEIAGP